MNQLLSKLKVKEVELMSLQEECSRLGTYESENEELKKKIEGMSKKLNDLMVTTFCTLLWLMSQL